MGLPSTTYAGGLFPFWTLCPDTVAFLPDATHRTFSGETDAGIAAMRGVYHRNPTLRTFQPESVRLRVLQNAPFCAGPEG